MLLCSASLVPAKYRFPLPDGSVPWQEPCFLHLGLCPEVQFGSGSKASSKELATHISAFCTHLLRSAKSPDVRRVSAQERNRKDGGDPEPLSPQPPALYPDVKGLVYRQKPRFSFSKKCFFTCGLQLSPLEPPGTRVLSWTVSRPSELSSLG